MTAARPTLLGAVLLVVVLLAATASAQPGAPDGAVDDRVAPETALRMTGALLDTDHPVRLMLYDEADRGPSPFHGDAFAETVRGLDRHLHATD